MSTKTARRYAKALFELAKEGGALQPTADDLAHLAAVAADATVMPVLRSPLLSAARRGELAASLVRELKLSDLLTRFVRLLADNRRLGDLPGINEHFQRLLDRELGRLRIVLHSPTALEGTQEQQLVAAFAAVTGKSIIPHSVVDPDLLGGVVVEVDGKVYDGSVRTQLHRLAKELTGTASV